MVQPKKHAGPGMGNRTTSTQPLTKKQSSAAPIKGGNKLASSVPSPPSFSSSSLSAESKKKGKAANRKDKKPRKPFNLFTFFLFVFALYSLYVCPQDYAGESSFCRGLNTYKESVVLPAFRRVVLPTYEHVVVPAFNRAMAEVVVPTYEIAKEQALDQLEKARSTEYGQKAEKFAVPAYHSARHGAEVAYRQALIPAYERIAIPTYNNVLVPAYDEGYKRVLLPTYHRVLVPAYERAWDAIAAQTAPYVLRVQQAAAPYVHQVKPYGLYVQRGYALSLELYEAAQPYGQQLWELLLQLFQLLQGLWETSRPHVEKVWDIASEHLGDARRQWVDPHVQVMWLKVLERAGRNAGEQDFQSRVTVAPAPAAETMTTEAPTHESTVAHDTKSSLVVTVTEAAATTSVVPAPTATPVLEAEEPIEEPTASVAETLSEEATSSLEPPAATPESDDIDAFLAALGLDSQEEASSVSIELEQAAAEADAPAQTVSPEEIAEKRAKLEARYQAHWEKVTSKADELAPVIRQRLLELRQAAVEDLNSLALPQALRDECDTLLGGAERYLERERTAVVDADRQVRAERFTKVVDRVQASFQDVTTGFQDGVLQTVSTARNTEVEECMAAGQQVKALAERAQADLGLDYAWLEDVTYNDWQRYHALLGIHVDFQEQLKQIQENTHPKPIADPLDTFLPELQNALKGEIVGCLLRVSKLKAAGDAVFKEKEEKEVHSEAGDLTHGGMFVGRGSEEVEEAIAKAPEEPKSVPTLEFTMVSGPTTTPEVDVPVVQSLEEKVAPSSVLPSTSATSAQEYATILPIGEPVVGDMRDFGDFHEEL
ncbi:hypothetical protein CYLTODRAFT_442232 [Cylindrobasidium torrendii FP15055 ss-10]|uniref:Uncharacterized protein n=1 Tax=Cylindrobasidium torrendii FP15055 ss-10 TaxID=1314674 RepID=A0A0D7BKI1_9AGAR|nr:hypothetical protein CYLTODRAFT_442232 [Cylindrobasidium torrendii FP15055 ss-10]